MKLSYYIKEDICSITIEERLILDRIAEFKQQTETILNEERPKGIVLHMNKTEKIDSAGIGAVVHLFRQTQQLQIPFCICQPNEYITDRLEMTRVDRTIPVYQTEQEAFAHFTNNLAM